jgi:hypothetical protein
VSTHLCEWPWLPQLQQSLDELPPGVCCCICLLPSTLVTHKRRLVARDTSIPASSPTPAAATPVAPTPLSVAAATAAAVSAVVIAPATIPAPAAPVTVKLPVVAAATPAGRQHKGWGIGVGSTSAGQEGSFVCESLLQGQMHGF